MYFSALVIRYRLISIACVAFFYISLEGCFNSVDLAVTLVTKVTTGNEKTNTKYFNNSALFGNTCMF